MAAGNAHSGGHPPKPRLALSVGVVGHRPNRLPKDQPGLTKLRAQVDQALDMLSVVACRALIAHQNAFAPEPALLSVLSGLADGADRIAALAVIGRPADDFRLDVALPFDPDEYKKDFKQAESRDEFDRLWAAARAVLTLPGTRKNADDPDDLEAKKAYEAAGLTILAQSDILLTIWDGGPSGGRGGTTEMLNTAARLGIPIIHIDATGAATPCIRWNQLSDYPVPVNAAEDLDRIALNQQKLDEVVDTLVRPPHQESQPHGLLHRHYSLAAYYRERFHAFDVWYLYRFPYPFLLAASLVRWFRGAETCPPAPQRLAAELRSMAPPETNEAEESSPERSAAARSIWLASAYGWADSVGTRFALIFRSAFVLNFMFAAFAVIAAAVSLVALDMSKPDEVFRHLAEHKMPYVVVELVLIAIVLLNTGSGWFGRWHPRWIEAREIAERLRVALPLWTLGTRPAVFHGEEPTWTGWYARAVIRAQGLKNVAYDDDSLKAAHRTLLAVLNDQCGYHGQTAKRMSNLEHRLERAGVVLFVITFAAAAAFLIARGAGWTITPWWAYLVTALAAGLPALATALYGIRVIGDFDGIAKRSARTRDELERLIAAVDADWPKDRRETELPKFALLRARARAAETAMLGDVQNWRLAAESRELTIPG